VTRLKTRIYCRHLGRRAVLPALVAFLALAFAASASQARVATSKVVLSAPTYAGYSTGIFRWSAVRKADHYQFELANDKSFNSPVLGNAGNFDTWSTSATLPATLQDGTYWWRVRAVRKSGASSKWVTRSFTKAWQEAPTLLTPGNNASIAFPDQPLLMSWKPVLGAVRYEVAIARDPKMTSLVDGVQTVTTATSYVPPATLSNGTYYWTVTPVDAEKHEGTTSVVRSFIWGWDPTTTLNVTNQIQNLVDAGTFYDPLFTWTRVKGAAKYQVEINYSADFNASSMVCCSATTVATGYSPTRPLPNNTYYWRVRAINAQGAVGAWYPKPPALQTFTQYFDTIPPLAQNAATITNLHVRDELGDSGPEPPGWATPSPILVWNRVAGASAYDLDIYTMRPDGVCDPQYGVVWSGTTPLTSWTPLSKSSSMLPYPATGTSLEKDTNPLVAGNHYCVRIRAVGETSSAGGRVYGDYTYLPAPGTPPGEGAFTYEPTVAPGSIALPQASDYISPISGNLTTQTPLFTWHPIAGAQSYWVIVARDPSFTTLVDYGFTRDPAYAPRITIADEKTVYYWAVLPAANADGTGLPIDPSTGQPVDPLHAHAAAFLKESTPPTLLLPQPGAVLTASQPTFTWTPVDGARNYRLQVSTDPNFGTLLDNVVTSSTAYVSTTTYPAQSTLYWRVQANDEDTDALTWSNSDTPPQVLGDSGTFKQVLPTPQPIAQQAPGGDSIPALNWAPVTGAIGYDVSVVSPGGSVQVFKNVPTPAMVPDKLNGTGTFSWQVRADFTGGAFGPYSATNTFQRTVAPPSQTGAAVSRHAVILHWQGRPGLEEYVVQIASRPDFSHTVETDKVEGTVVASNLKAFTKAGGKFYWRIAAVDADGNLGGYSPTKTFKIHKVKAG
jgi:hypothetical protein